MYPSTGFRSIADISRNQVLMAGSRTARLRCEGMCRARALIGLNRRYPVRVCVTSSITAPVSFVNPDPRARAGFTVAKLRLYIR